MSTDLPDRLRSARETLGLSQKEIASKIGSSWRGWQANESGKTIPGGKVLDGLAKLGINLNWLLLGEGSMWLGEKSAEVSAGGTLSAGSASLPAGSGPRADPDEYAYLPLYAVEASAGFGRENGPQPRIEQFLAFRRDWLSRHLCAAVSDLYLLYVAGDSMEPTLLEGDIVLLQRIHAAPRRDGIHVLRVGDALHVKRVQFFPGGKAEITSDNSIYKPFTVDLNTPNNNDQVELIGRVIWCGKRM